MRHRKRSKLEDYIDLQTGHPFASNQYSKNSEDTPLLCGENIGQGFINWNDTKRWPSSNVEAYERYFLKENDVVLAMDRPWIELGLKFASVSKHDLPCLLLQRTARLRGRKSLDTTYLKYIIASPWFTKYIRNINTGSLVPHISGDQIKEFKFPIPTIEEQKKVSGFLATIDQKIDVNQQIFRALQKLCETIYDYWCVQHDFPNEDGQPFKSSGGAMVFDKELKRSRPLDWDTKSLFDIANFSNGLALQNYRPVSNEYLPVIKIREMSDGFSNSSEKAKTDLPQDAIVNDGDILFSWSATLDVMMWAGGQGALNQHIFKVTSNKFPKYFYFFEIQRYLKHFKMLAELRKTTMGHITQDHLKQAVVMVPPKRILDSLGLILTPMLEKQLYLRKEALELKKLRNWILPMLMNGQIAVQD
jgi:type I restriction enzyme S subunit